MPARSESASTACCNALNSMNLADPVELLLNGTSTCIIVIDSMVCLYMWTIY